MDSKKHRGLNITLILLASLSVGMFAYANVYQPNFAPKEKVTVYVAAENIPAHVDLSADMFRSVKVDKDSYINGAVTNLDGVIGKQLSAKLLKGEILFKGRIAEESESDGPLIAEIRVPTSMPLRHNDTIRIYVQYIEEDGKVTVEELFHEKKVISRDVLANSKGLGNMAEQLAKEAVSTSSDGSVIYVRLTDEEVMEYQKALNTGELYVVKVEGEEAGETMSSGKTVSERPAKEKDDEKTHSVGYYEVQEGDTVESIAKRFMTTPEVIVELNGGATKFKTGQRIKVPAN
ncbi:LysM peptidoglycan-binding domain-containing protein [Caldibacillus debilis]|uniref:LysM domain n=1 Tax=Caldibacillus debilis GB1 TaxID=1339248 RepID=A0A420VE18_9BACI|nr:LysM peptidoglycan-binding domain-containing protein [Caldibacillus debilis]RKO61795.1 LysM domain [Caldibacillus debilis GB1]